MPWLLLAVGLLLLAVALPLAVVAFLRAASPSSFGGQAFSLITGQPQEESGNLPLLLIVLGCSAAVAFLGAALSLTSLFVLTKRGARRAVVCTRVAAGVVGQHHLAKQAKQALAESRGSIPERGRQIKESIKAQQVKKEPKQLEPPGDS